MSIIGAVLLAAASQQGEGKQYTHSQSTTGVLPQRFKCKVALPKGIKYNSGEHNTNTSTAQENSCVQTHYRVESIEVLPMV